jgi:hypothetical protein
MIVRADGKSLHLISQPDHATLARRIMERWIPLHDVERRASILLAIEEHDNGWREPDAAPMVNRETGRVYDFVDIPAEIRQAVWPRGVRRLADEDVWAAALVAQHAITVYSRYQTDPAWAAFFPQLEALRDNLIDTADRTFAQLTHDYVFVRVGDLVSLMFCTGWDEPQAFDRWSVRRDGNRVIVSPDAFGGMEWPIAVRAREIPARAYSSDDDLQRTIRESPIVTLAGSVGAATVAV